MSSIVARPLSLIVALSLTCVLIGCDRKKSQFADGINKEIQGEKSKFATVKKDPPTWPMRIDDLAFVTEPRAKQILNAMQSAGYLKITKEANAMGTAYVIAPTDEAKGWWNVQDGFCVGRKEVVEVKKWTEPGAGSGAPMQMTEVQYTWHLTDVPAWAKRAEFNDIAGMVSPVDGVAHLRKMNDGWEAVLAIGDMRAGKGEIETQQPVKPWASGLSASPPSAQQFVRPPVDIGYLKEMPEPARVLSDVKGSDPGDVAARQCGALSQLERMIVRLGQGRYQNKKLTSEEAKLSAAYIDAMQPLKLKYQELGQKWVERRTHYEVNPAFRDELIKRYFSADWQARYGALVSTR